MFARPALLLSLLALTAACGPTEVDTDSATGASGSSSTGSSSEGDDTTESGSTTESESATEVAPTTGEMEFPMCQEPLTRADVGFTFESATLGTFDLVDVMCEVVGSANDDPSVSAVIDLTCVDAEAAMHAVHIELRLFDGAAALALTTLKEVHLVHYKVDDFTYREVLAVHTPDDKLLLYAGAGYTLFTAEDAALQAPLTFVPVAEELCVTEVLDECDQRRRSALDVSFSNIHERVFDRDEATLAGYAVHLGEAVDIDLYAGDFCAGDSIDGLEASLVVYATNE